MPSTAVDELARLIAQQAADDAARRLPPWGHRRESELSRRDGSEFSLDRVADPSALEAVERLILGEGKSAYEQSFLVGLVGTGLVWDASIVAYDASTPCPACEGHPMDNRAHCLICSRSAEQPKQHPMIGTPTRAARPSKAKPRSWNDRMKAADQRKAARKAVEVELAGGTGPKAPRKPGRRRNPWVDWMPAAW